MEEPFIKKYQYGFSLTCHIGYSSFIVIFAHLEKGSKYFSNYEFSLMRTSYSTNFPTAREFSMITIPQNLLVQAIAMQSWK